MVGGHAGQEGDLIGLIFAEGIGYHLHRRIPIHFHSLSPTALFALKRIGDAVRIIQAVKCSLAARTGLTEIDGVILVPLDL